MKKERFYKVLIAILVVINVVTLMFFWLAKPPHHPPGMGPKLSDQLGVEAPKKTQMDILEEAHHQEKRKLMQKDRDLHELLFSHVGTSSNTDELQEKIALNKIEIESMTYDFFDSIAKLCNEEQKKSLQTLIRHGIHQIHGPRR